MAAARKSTNMQGPTAILVIEVVAIVLAVYFVRQRDWTSFTWSASVLVAIPLWIAAFKVRTRCRVITAKGRRCPNPTTGVLFGCRQANHGWAKLLARFGLDRRPVVKQGKERSTPAPQASAVTTSGVFNESAPPLRVQVESGRKDALLFWFATCATVSGLASAAVDITSLFK